MTLALFAVLAALVSAAVSRYTSLSFSKVLSLFLLFIVRGDWSDGSRSAGRENRFFSGLLTGCEVFVAAIAATYFVGMEVMGNPNSLGAVMGVAAAPILLWGTLLEQQGSLHLPPAIVSVRNLDVLDLCQPCASEHAGGVGFLWIALRGLAQVPSAGAGAREFSQYSWRLGLFCAQKHFQE